MHPWQWIHSCFYSEVETCSGMNISSSQTIDDCHPTQLLSEMELLKERNKCMEGELKEMQERYSEISLKFAEVEGERQQLVMTVRNLRNSKKTSFFWDGGNLKMKLWKICASRVWWVIAFSDMVEAWKWNYRKIEILVTFITVS